MHTIKNQSNIKKETIKLVSSLIRTSTEYVLLTQFLTHESFNVQVPLPNEPNKYSLELKFDANYECVITVYLCAMECRNAANIPLYFYSDP